MIATVKIAPTEQWCAINLRDLRDFPVGLKLVGMEVEILTETMEPHADGCDGRCWQVSDKTYQEWMRIFGSENYDTEDLWLCEHMLEMD